MVSRLKRLFRRQESADPDRGEPAKAPLHSLGSDLIARMMAAEETAWWKDQKSAIAETDEQLAVLGPQADATVEELQSLGETLKQWQAAHEYVRHIWGLDDLLNGQGPRTPPVYLMVPYEVDSLAESYESVALVYVAKGTDHKQAKESLVQALGEGRSSLAWFTDPMSYSDMNR